MEALERRRGVGAARTVAASCGLDVDEAVVLHDSTRLAVRLRPCDVLARVAPCARQGGAEFEVEVARRVGATGAPVAPLDPRVEPRVYEEDGFAVTLWTYCEQTAPHAIAPDEYAGALARLHAGFRNADPAGEWTPHFMDRVHEAQRLIDDPANNPEIAGKDRALVAETLRTVSAAILEREAPEQLLHGEPHRGNVLRTKDGLLFVDLETCCRGPVEFDVAHAGDTTSGPSVEVARQYAGADLSLVRDCWLLMLAMIIAWRCEPGDDLPNGRALTRQWINLLRSHGPRAT